MVFLFFLVFLVFLVLLVFWVFFLFSVWIFRTVLVESHEILFFFSFFVIRGTGESRNIVVTWVFLVLQQRQKAEKVHAHSPPFCIYTTLET